MNTVLDVPFPPPSAEPCSIEQPAEAEAKCGSRLQAAIHTARDDFAERQIRGLVQQVFFPGWPRPARQVVFSAVDPDTDTAAVCARVCRAMAQQLPGTVCAVEAHLRSPALQQKLTANDSHFAGPASSSKSGIQLEPNFWLLTGEAFLGENPAGSDAVWLRSRLSELRREFDYTAIHAPAAGLFSETVLISQLADGVILVLDAHSTRRAAAQKARQLLLAANVRLLGTVLNQRTFPIPERIYRQL